MKRTVACLLLTLLAPGAAPVPAQHASAPPDVAVRGLRAVNPTAAQRLCVGSRNAVRAELDLTGAAPPAAVLLRLTLVVPGGDPAGIAIAEGSGEFTGGATSRSFTFMNVEVPERLRGRGAVLEVRANLDRALPERNLANNAATLDLERATDWKCRG